MELRRWSFPPRGGDPDSIRRALSLVVFVIVGWLMTQSLAERSPRELAIGLALFAIAGGLCWWSSQLWDSPRLLLLSLAVMVGCALALWALWPGSQAWMLLVWAVGTLGGVLPLRIALLATVATYGAFLLTAIAFVAEVTPGAGGLGWTAMLFGAVLIMGAQRQSQRRYLRQMEEMVVALRSYSEQLEDAHRQLQAEALQTAALAAAEERNRIAREIHDVLAHSLTIIVVQAQAIKRLVRNDPNAAEQQADTVAQLAREGLQEARRSVSALRATPPGVDGLSTLRALVEGFGTQTQTLTAFNVDGDPAALSPNTWTTLYRVTQEALTNARRHGQAHQIDVHLAVDGRAHLQVADDGVATATMTVAVGNGLTGMGERAVRLGGSLTYGPRAEGGFRVEVDLPL